MNYIKVIERIASSIVTGLAGNIVFQAFFIIPYFKDDKDISRFIAAVGYIEINMMVVAFFISFGLWCLTNRSKD